MVISGPSGLGCLSPGPAPPGAPGSPQSPPSRIVVNSFVPRSQFSPAPSPQTRSYGCQGPAPGLPDLRKRAHSFLLPAAQLRPQDKGAAGTRPQHCVLRAQRAATKYGQSIFHPAQTGNWERLGSAEKMQRRGYVTHFSVKRSLFKNWE